MPNTLFSQNSLKARTVRRAISDLIAQGLPARELLDEVEKRLKTVVPFDDGGWWTSDPETLLPTELWRFDFDAVKRELATNGHVALESSDVEKTGGEAPDLRVLARNGDTAWGAACLTRIHGARPFSPEEISFITTIAKEVGFALRADLLRVATGAKTETIIPTPGPGTLLLTEDDIVEGFTPEAQSWLGELGVDDMTVPLPTALRWISLQARASADLKGTGHITPPARARLVTNSGGLVVVQAEVLHGAGSLKVVMSLESATAKSLFPLLLSLHDLTSREKTVAELLVAGWSLDQISARLSLSLYTVRDHVKAIYTKVGVRSRPELTAHLGSGPSAGMSTGVARSSAA